MKVFFYLKTCSTCQRILNTLQLPKDVEQVDIKSNPLTEKQLEAMRLRTDSYESLFSKRARLYQELGLKDQALSEEDFKKYLLQHYTFLKRPVLIWEDNMSIGNSKKEVQKAATWIHESK